MYIKNRWDIHVEMYSTTAYIYIPLTDHSIENACVMFSNDLRYGFGYIRDCKIYYQIIEKTWQFFKIFQQQNSKGLSKE